jgi:putative ABC transport system permease protein
MIRFKVKLAIRNLLKNKLYSFLIIGGFAIGFTASILIGLFYSAESNVDRHFSDYKNIFRLYDAKKSKSGLDYKLNPVLSENYPDIKKTCPVGFSYFPITLKDPQTKNHIRIEHVISTNDSFFDVFSIKILSILEEQPFSQQNSAVITESIAKKLFGDQNPLGRTINQEIYSATVTAGMEYYPGNTTNNAQLRHKSGNKYFQMSQQCTNGECKNPVEHLH